jgi:hypothetical protein
MPEVGALPAAPRRGESRAIEPSAPTMQARMPEVGVLPAAPRRGGESGNRTWHAITRVARSRRMSHVRSVAALKMVAGTVWGMREIALIVI